MTINKKYLKILDTLGKEKQNVNENPDDKILIIDGLNTFIRVFSIYPTQNDDGIHIGGIVGFLKSLGHAIRTIQPTRCIIVFDGKGGSSRRRKMFPGYKNNRKPTLRKNRVGLYSANTDEKRNMIIQFQRIIEYLENLPITVLSVDNVEADDVIAYIGKQVYNKPENKIVVMSTDKDFLQLVNGRISVWNPTKKRMYHPEQVEKDYGIPSHNFLVYRMLDGDVSDSIPGIQGWGLKTIAKKLPMIMEDKKLEVKDLVEYSKNQEGKIFKNLLDNVGQLDLNYKLMQLDDVDISGSIKMKVVDIVKEPIQQLVKFKFQKMFMEDKLYTALPNLTSWLITSFNRLNNFANRTHK